MAKLVERARCGRIASADQDIVASGFALLCQNEPGCFTQSPLGPVARDGIADLFRTGEPDTDPLGPLRLAHLNRKSGTRYAPRSRRCNKVSAFCQDSQAGQGHCRVTLRDDETASGCPRRLYRGHVATNYALSDFRPRARRAFRILRPAFVAIRARKPWRRFRTKFDG